MSSKKNHTVILNAPSYVYRTEVIVPTPQPRILPGFLSQSLHPKQRYSPMLLGNNYFRKPTLPFSLCPPAKTQRGFLLYHQPLCPPLDESRSKPAYKQTGRSPVIKTKWWGRSRAEQRRKHRLPRWLHRNPHLLYSKEVKNPPLPLKKGFAREDLPLPTWMVSLDGYHRMVLGGSSIVQNRLFQSIALILPTCMQVNLLKLVGLPLEKKRNFFWEINRESSENHTFLTISSDKANIKLTWGLHI